MVPRGLFGWAGWMGLVAAACGSEPVSSRDAAPPPERAEPGAAPDAGSAADAAAPAPLPPVPPPTRPFAAGDTIPEGFAREPANTTGHAAFRAGVPLPWRCSVVSRT